MVLPADVPEDPVQQQQETEYAPKKFQKAQIQYFREQMKANIQHKDALKMWMLSTERADLLRGISESQLKKRRFM